MKPPTPAKQLDAFLAKYAPEIARRARQALSKLRRRLPGAVEMVYDNYNALVIGFGPSDRPADAILSLVLYPRWVRLFFLQGASLPDPKRKLEGKCKLVRHLKLAAPDDLDDPIVEELIRLALERASTPFRPGTRRRLIIKSIAATQRARRG